MKTKPFKTWKIEEAQRRGVSLRAIQARIERGTIKLPKLQRINKRVINVIES